MNNIALYFGGLYNQVGYQTHASLLLTCQTENISVLWSVITILTFSYIFIPSITSYRCRMQAAWCWITVICTKGSDRA